jgi:ethanolamine ammonia-lyase large subunit
MVTLEARKYGFIRYLAQFLKPEHWIIVNDVAGFIGPEVFRTREQLSRAVHEDIVMGKLHALTIGSDVCATLHMNLSMEDLDWCLDSIIPVGPSHLMALPTKCDPMLGYLTTGRLERVYEMLLF